MNLPPEWCEVLRQEGWTAIHWSAAGSPTAQDREVMAFAAQGNYIVLTHDLDFSAMLAATQAIAPSVVQVRAQDTLSPQVRNQVVSALRQFETVLQSGAIVVIEQFRARARVLPLPTSGM